MVKCKIVDVVHFLRLATRSRSFASSWPPLSLPMLPPSLPARFSCPFFASDIPVFHIVLKRFEKAFPSFSCESTRKSSPILKFLTTSSLKILQSPPQVQIQLFSFALPLTLALPGRWRFVDLDICLDLEIWRSLKISSWWDKFSPQYRSYGLALWSPFQWCLCRCRRDPKQIILPGDFSHIFCQLFFFSVL